MILSRRGKILQAKALGELQN